jgi:hypothetical protein
VEEIIVQGDLHQEDVLIQEDVHLKEGALHPVVEVLQEKSLSVSHEVKRKNPHLIVGQGPPQALLKVENLQVLRTLKTLLKLKNIRNKRKH